MAADRKRPTSALTKLLIGFFGAIVCVVVATQLLMQYSVTRFSRTAIRAELERDAALLREQLRGDLVPLAEDNELGRTARQARLSRLAERLDVRISLIDPSGRLLADSHIPPERLPTAPQTGPEIVDARAHGIGVVMRESQIFDGDELFYVAVPMDEGANQGTLLRLSIWASHIELSAASMRETLYWIASGTVAGALFFSLLLAGWLTRPLRRFGRTARQVSHGEAPATQLEKVAASGELYDLAEAFVDLSTQLEKLRSRVRADSPHLNVLLEALDTPVIFVNPAGQIVRTNEAARSQLELLYTMRDLEEANLSELRLPLLEALENESPLCTVLERGRDDDDDDDLDEDELASPGGPPERMQATIFPMNAPGHAQGAVILLTALDETPGRRGPVRRAALHT